MSDKHYQITYIITVIFFLAIITQYIVLNNNLLTLKEETEQEILDLNFILTEHKQLIENQETQISNLQTALEEHGITIEEMGNRIAELENLTATLENKLNKIIAGTNSNYDSIDFTSLNILNPNGTLHVTPDTISWTKADRNKSS